MPMEKDFMGKKLTVKITEAGKHYMKCVLVDNEKISRPGGVPEPLKQGQVSGADNPQTQTVSSTTKPSGYHPLLIVSLVVLVTSLLLRLYYTLVAPYKAG